MQISPSKRFITAGLVGLCLVMVAQPARADWIQVRGWALRSQDVEGIYSPAPLLSLRAGRYGGRPACLQGRL